MVEFEYWESSQVGKTDYYAAPLTVVAEGNLVSVNGNQASVKSCWNKTYQSDHYDTGQGFSIRFIKDSIYYSTLDNTGSGEGNRHYSGKKF